ncbi:hypothetical protein AYL99_10519 [Fonsecaea erecta]|uniref:ABM domain-containing protein n=1 Tax=Fonsecaea erecta TaxID=1367422 RepID=A0A178Z7Z0_9EURO|nr:hypothetical protein AYL99_10519 [Fonsecaea erecta]OAP55546.1 hypothetical protein AYL99_10519 [Fonsecaea erecta]
MSSSTKVPDRYMIHVTLWFAPENVPIALEACRKLFAEAWKDPRLDFCQIVRDANDPGVIRIQEEWNASRQYLDEVRVESSWPSLVRTERDPENGMQAMMWYLPSPSDNL